MKNILFKSLLNGVVTLFALALILSWMNGLRFVEALVLPYIITAAVTACLASFIGFVRKANSVSLPI